MYVFCGIARNMKRLCIQDKRVFMNVYLYFSYRKCKKKPKTLSKKAEESWGKIIRELAAV